jgi:hypothetical protein
VDVVVVDPGRFDQVWYALLEWDYRIGAQKGYRKKWQLERRADIYWGYVLTKPFPSLKSIPLRNVLRPIRDLSDEWFDAFQSVGLRHPRLAGRKFSGRLYRSWQHAESYHVDGLRIVRDKPSPSASATS